MIHVQSYCRYGSSNIYRDLLHKGIACCVNTVAKRMKEHGIQSIVHPKFRVTTTDSSHSHPVFENRMDRDFTATGMNRKWAADITYIPTGEGFLYLVGIVDMFSRRIVGWALKDTLHADLCLEAPEMDLPIFVLPVKLMTRTSLDSTSSAEPPPPVTSLKTLTTPLGKSAASDRTLANHELVCAVFPGSLMTVVTPAASAGASERTVRTSGELKGAMMPATPIGDRVTNDV